MKVVCIHFKGGVGKSTTAVHVVGVLSGLAGQKTLLVDGDRQVTSYSFFNAGRTPENYEELSISSAISLIPLQTSSPSTGLELGKRLRKITKISYDNLVIDTTPDPATTNQILSEISPDLVLIPVKSDDMGSHAQLSPLLNTIARMAAVGIKPRVKIIPLGGSEASISPYVDAPGLVFEFSESVPLMHEAFGEAVYNKFCYVWNFEGCENIYDIYRRIVME